jgi:hypothetical protein
VGTIQNVLQGAAAAINPGLLAEALFRPRRNAPSSGQSGIEYPRIEVQGDLLADAWGIVGVALRDEMDRVDRREREDRASTPGEEHSPQIEGLAEADKSEPGQGHP